MYLVSIRILLISFKISLQGGKNPSQSLREETHTVTSLCKQLSTLTLTFITGITDRNAGDACLKSLVSRINFKFLGSLWISPEG